MLGKHPIIISVTLLSFILISLKADSTTAVAMRILTKNSQNIKNSELQSQMSHPLQTSSKHQASNNSSNVSSSLNNESNQTSNSSMLTTSKVNNKDRKIDINSSLKKSEKSLLKLSKNTKQANEKT